MSSGNFECPYCHKQYVRETAYHNHYCEQMRRHDEMKTPTGQAAYNFYCNWMKSNRRKPPKIETFMESRFYRNFYNFAQFAEKVNMGKNADQFIELMVKHDISPNLWTYDRAYSLFVEQYDRTVPVLKQVETTVDQLYRLADAYDCDIEQVFDTAKPAVIIEMIRQKLLTPWILLNSSKFKQSMRSYYTTEQRKIIEGLIRPMYWKVRFDNNRKTVQIMKKIVKEMRIN